MWLEGLVVVSVLAYALGVLEVRLARKMTALEARIDRLEQEGDHDYYARTR